MYLFFLPLYEAPKHLFSFFTVVLAVIGFRFNSVKNKINIYLLLGFFIYALTILVSGAGTFYFDLKGPLYDNFDYIKLVAIPICFFLCCKQYDELSILRIVLISGLVGMLESFGPWNSGDLEINSVGHPNHSALFVGLLVVIGAVLSVSDRSAWRFLYIGVCFLGFYWISEVRSIVAFGAVTIALSSHFLVFERRSSGVSLFKLFWVLVLIVLLIIVSSSSENIVTEFIGRLVGSTERWSQRDLILNAGVLVFLDSPVFGVGAQQFSVSMDPARLATLYDRYGEHLWFASGDWFLTSHGHGLFVNVGVERGMVGLIGLCILLFLSVRTALYNIQNSLDDSIKLNSKLILACLVFGVMAGFGNTTFHNEHGALLFCLMAMLLRTKKSGGATNENAVTAVD